MTKMSLLLVFVMNLDINAAGCLEHMCLEPVCPGTFKSQINAVLSQPQFSQLKFVDEARQDGMVDGQVSIERTGLQSE